MEEINDLIYLRGEMGTLFISLVLQYCLLTLVSWEGMLMCPILTASFDKNRCYDLKTITALLYLGNKSSTTHVIISFPNCEMFMNINMFWDYKFMPKSMNPIWHQNYNRHIKNIFILTFLNIKCIILKYWYNITNNKASWKLYKWTLIPVPR